jgi:23S rRNA pseudouridine1911/1915/1917 synthase
MKKRLLTRASGDPDSLVALLRLRLGVDVQQAKTWIYSGAVYLGAARVTSDAPVRVGDRITVYVGDPASAVGVPTVVHQDDWIAVLDKPAGMASQSEKSRSSGALDAFAQRAFGERARMLHRLDKEASGLVLFSLDERALPLLQKALDAGEIDRRYVAVVDGDLRGEGTIRLRIARHPTDRRLRAALPENAPAGQAACSRFRALAHSRWQSRAVSAAELTLDTGRTHQLRVHLSAAGHAIVGDTAYGGPAYERMCLHAHALELPHPRDGQPLRLSSRVPDSFSAVVPGLTHPFT